MGEGSSVEMPQRVALHEATKLLSAEELPVSKYEDCIHSIDSVAWKERHSLAT